MIAWNSSDGRVSIELRKIEVTEATITIIAQTGCTRWRPGDADAVESERLRDVVLDPTVGAAADAAGVEHGGDLVAQQDNVRRFDGDVGVPVGFQRLVPRGDGGEVDAGVGQQVRSPQYVWNRFRPPARHLRDTVGAHPA